MTSVQTLVLKINVDTAAAAQKAAVIAKAF
jgi:hypothetical protein